MATFWKGKRLAIGLKAVADLKLRPIATYIQFYDVIICIESSVPKYPVERSAVESTAYCCELNVNAAQRAPARQMTQQTATVAVIPASWFAVPPRRGPEFDRKSFLDVSNSRRRCLRSSVMERSGQDGCGAGAARQAQLRLMIMMFCAWRHDSTWAYPVRLHSSGSGSSSSRPKATGDSQRGTRLTEKCHLNVDQQR